MPLITHTPRYRFPCRMHQAAICSLLPACRSSRGSLVLSEGLARLCSLLYLLSLACKVFQCMGAVSMHQHTKFTERV